MESCCIRGCDSYKDAATKNIGYFKFPLHDSFLLRQWRRPIRRVNGPDWVPTDSSQICSVHFKESDFRRVPFQRLFFLIPYSVPSVFPYEGKKKLLQRKRRIEEITTRNESMEVIDDAAVPHRNKVSLLRRKAKPANVEDNELKPHGEPIETRNVVLSPVQMVSQGTLKRDKPFLRITVNKKINVPTSSASKPEPFETVYLPYHEDNEHTYDDERVKKESSESDDMEIVEVGSELMEESSEQYSQIDDMEIVKIEGDPGSCEQINTTPDDHSYSCDIGSTNSKDSEDLGKRLEELRERRKQEQLKIVRLQMELSEVEKKMKENNSEKIVVPDLGSGKKVPRNKSSWLLREKEEYENLLKDVREIKLKVLRERHDKELNKIRKLQAQMINLSKKMRENDDKEIALSNVRAMNNTVAVRPDWMKREEEEYEKLLEDVRQIKEIYCVDKKPKEKDDDLGTKKNTDARCKTENIISDEDCVVIETMQDNETRIVDDEYGEVIGEIDEDSVDIDISKEESISFNDELSDSGLLDI